MPGTPSPAAVGAPDLAPPPAPAGAGGGEAHVGRTLNMTVNGTVVRLEADKVAMFRQLLDYVLGPEGAAAVEDFLRQTPGPRTPAAR